LGISARVEGVSNVNDDNLEHIAKDKFPRAETEEGRVKEIKLEHPLKAQDSIVRITAGDSNAISVNSEQSSKQCSPMRKTELGI
jgi:hypothetical protein